MSRLIDINENIYLIETFHIVQLLPWHRYSDLASHSSKLLGVFLSFLLIFSFLSRLACFVVFTYQVR